MRICHIVPSVEARHGGPSKSVRSLAEATARLGHEVDLLATCPGVANEPAEKGNLRVYKFRRNRPEFLCASTGLKEHLRERSYDCIHHHSLWLRTLHYAAKAGLATGQPLVLSPRGMMTDWAWKHHRWKKWLASKLVHPGALAAAGGWHATSADEADDIRRRGFSNPICVAPNGVDGPTAEDQLRSLEAWTQLCPLSTGRPVALFYSRFHRKKRLLELIDLWADAAPREWLLLVAGIPEEYSMDDLRSHLRRRSLADRVAVVDATDRPPPYCAASIFLLPSHTENFGMVIAEAMAWGLPVLVTDTTPWKEVTAQDAGWCVSWGGYRDTLRTALSESPERLKQRGAQARRWVLARYSWAQSAAALVEFYDKLQRR